MERLLKTGNEYKAKEILQLTLDRGVTITATFFLPFLDYYLSTNQLPRAMEVLNVIKGKGIKQTSVIYTKIISHMAKNDDVERAIAVLNSIPSDMNACSPFFNNIVLKLIETDQDDRAHKYLKIMESKGVEFDVGIYATLISQYSKKKKEDIVGQYLREARSKTFEFDDVLYSTIIFAFIRNGSWHNAENVWREMWEKLGIERMDDFALNLGIKIFLQIKNLQQAVLLLQKMRETGREVWATMYASFAQVLHSLDEEQANIMSEAAQNVLYHSDPSRVVELDSRLKESVEKILEMPNLDFMLLDPFQ